MTRRAKTVVRFALCSNVKFGAAPKCNESKCRTIKMLVEANMRFLACLAVRDQSECVRLSDRDSVVISQGGGSAMKN